MDEYILLNLLEDEEDELAFMYLHEVMLQIRFSSNYVPVNPHRNAFSLESIRHSDAHSLEAFLRFSEDEFIRLAEKLLPPLIRTSIGITVSRTEALALVLRKLAFPARYNDLRIYFNRSEGNLCTIFTETVDMLMQRVSPLLDFKVAYFRPLLASLAQAVENKGAALDCCIGFIDGTGRSTCR